MSRSVQISLAAVMSLSLVVLGAQAQAPSPPAGAPAQAPRASSGSPPAGAPAQAPTAPTAPTAPRAPTASFASPPAGAPTQPSAPENPSAYDPRTVSEQVQALAGVLALREKQLHAAGDDLKALDQKREDDLKALDATWRREFDGWCAGRPACGLEPKKTEAEPAK
jgi:hypothetical protein